MISLPQLKSLACVSRGSRIYLKIQHESHVRILDLVASDRRRIALQPLLVLLAGANNPLKLVAFQTRLVCTSDDAQHEIDVVLLCGRRHQRLD